MLGSSRNVGVGGGTETSVESCVIKIQKQLVQEFKV